MTETINTEQRLELQEERRKKPTILKRLGSVGAFVGALAAFGSILGLLIAIYNWREERPDLDIRIGGLDLISYVPESQRTLLTEEIASDLSDLERQYSDITEDHVINVAQGVYNLIVNSDRVAIKHPENGTESVNFYEALVNSLDDNIAQLKEKRNSIPAGEEGNADRDKYNQLISGLERIQKKVDESIDTKEKVSLEVRAENSSRLSNYLDSQGILMVYKDEISFSAVPQIIVNLVNSDDEPNPGQVEGHGVSSMFFEAEVEDLQADDEFYIDLAFQSRAEGDETYNLMFAIDDIKDRMWYEQALFSTFTERKIKQEIKTKAEGVFNRNIER